MDSEQEIIKDKMIKVEDRISTIKSQINLIDERIRELDSQSIIEKCPMCLESMKNKEPCMFLCCKNFICYNCLSNYIKYNYTTCCLCRQSIKNEHIIKFMKRPKSVKTKNETIDMVVDECFTRNEENTRILIFASDIGQIKVTKSHYIINGNFTETLIERYNKGVYNLLLLNTKQHAFGLNLTNTTDIIFYHKMTEELSNQIIGRAQRIGRKCQLNVYHLIYDVI